jgi:hypothetical protein
MQLRWGNAVFATRSMPSVALVGNDVTGGSIASIFRVNDSKVPLICREDVSHDGRTDGRTVSSLSWPSVGG